MIEAFIIAWNEEEIIEFTIKHYRKYCDRINIFDNFSTDRTREIAQDLGCNVKLFGIKGELNDKEYLKVKNHAWKGSKAHFVIVCDTDEILLIGDNNLEGTIFNTHGFSIWANEMPKKSFLELTKGVVDDAYSKKVMFSPKLKEIGYIYGCHECRPQGELIYGKDMVLLHYHNIGGVERIIRRHKAYEERRGELNRRWGMGRQYAETPEFKRKEWAEYYDKRIELSQAGISFLQGTSEKIGL